MFRGREPVRRGTCPNGRSDSTKASSLPLVATRVACPVSELLLDPQQLVVLSHTLGARGSARLDLADAGCDREVRDERVLGLARAVRDHASVAGIAGQRNCV